MDVWEYEKALVKSTKKRDSHRETDRKYLVFKLADIPYRLFQRSPQEIVRLDSRLPWIQLVFCV